MPALRVNDHAVSGFLRLVDKGFSVEMARKRFGLSHRSAWRAINRELAAQAEQRQLTRCPGCGCKPLDDCIACRESAIRLAKQLLSRGVPLDAVAIRVAAEFPHLTQAQLADALNPLLLLPLVHS